MQGYQRHIQRRCIAHIKRCIPLTVFVAKPDHDHIGPLNQRAGPDGVDLGAFVIMPEAVLLRAEDVDAGVIAGGMLGHRRKKFNFSPVFLAPNRILSRQSE